MTTIATTTDGVEIEAGDYLVAGRGEDADCGWVRDDGSVAWDSGVVEDAATVAREGRADLAVYASRSDAAEELARRERAWRTAEADREARRANGFRA
jgi:hypothetical protein